jgi:hypothetical protein
MGDGVERALVTARPRRGLIATAVASFALVMVPVFGLLYWFAAESGRWGVVLAVHLAMLAVGAVVWVRQLRVYAIATATHLEGNGIFSPVIRVAMDEIADVRLVDTYTPTSPDLVTQLLVRDADGRRLWRMRGNYWHRADLDALVATLPVPAVHAGAPVSLREFFRSYPGAAYWFEDRLPLRIGVAGAGIAGAITTAALLMAVVGVPLGFGQ